MISDNNYNDYNDYNKNNDYNDYNDHNDYNDYNNYNYYKYYNNYSDYNDYNDYRDSDLDLCISNITIFCNKSISFLILFEKCYMFFNYDSVTNIIFAHQLTLSSTVLAGLF